MEQRDGAEGRSGSESELREGALRLLARREHSRKELERKLTSREWSASRVDRILDELAAEGLQSDARFAAEHLRSRVNRGYGPRKILAELVQKGVSRELAARTLDAADVDWAGVARGIYLTRFGDDAPSDRKERARRWRAMERRGFPGDVIAGLLE